MNQVEKPIEAADDRALRLGVLDVEDLAVVSAHLQDAHATMSDMVYRPGELRFAMVVSRFDWAQAARGQFQRCRTGVHFERVLKVARNRFFDRQPEATHQLLAIAFTLEDAPSGVVLLTFAGGAQIRLTVECLEAEMRDLGPRWPVEERPGHPAESAAPAPVAAERNKTPA